MGNSFPWIPPDSSLLLREKELHVWRSSLDVPDALLPRMTSVLDAGERARAEKFLVAGARKRFIAARGILRELLAMYLRVDARNLEFRYGPQGKPSLSAAHNS